jgi:predicted nucleic acid-binding protein
VILVDTDVLIAHLRGLEPARGWLASARRAGPVAVSVITVAELTGGMRSHERSAVLQLLSSLQLEPVTDVIARTAGAFQRRYRRSHSGIGLPDYLIAATADVLGDELATLNLKHFPMLPGLTAPFTL